jgi:alpha-L-rhamnosidase
MSKRIHKISVLCLLCIIFVLASYAERSQIQPVLLTCEKMTNPSVIDVASPRLSWINEAASDRVRDEYQQAYRICVASSKAKILKGEADIWDSGKTSSPK